MAFPETVLSTSGGLHHSATMSHIIKRWDVLCQFHKGRAWQRSSHKRCCNLRPLRYFPLTVSLNNNTERWPRYLSWWWLYTPCTWAICSAATCHPVPLFRYPFGLITWQEAMLMEPINNIPYGETAMRIHEYLVFMKSHHRSTLWDIAQLKLIVWVLTFSPHIVPKITRIMGWATYVILLQILHESMSHGYGIISVMMPMQELCSNLVWYGRTHTRSQTNSMF